MIESLNDLFNYIANKPATIITNMQTIPNQCVCSIIIPTYNNSQQQYIDLFNSINNQTYADKICTIVIDDGSTLGILTKNFLDMHLHTDYILVKLDFNRGVGYARTLGFTLLFTEYFAIIDADDVWESPNAIEEYITYLKNNPDVAAVCGNEYNEVHGNTWDGFGMHGLCAHKDLLQHVHFQPTHYAEDASFILPFEILGLKTVVLPFVTYRRREGNLTNSVESRFVNMNEYNNYYILTRAIAHLTNTTNYEHFDRIKLQTLTSLLHILCLNLGVAHDQDWPESSFATDLKHYRLTKSLCYLIQLYYLIKSVKEIPKDELAKIYLGEYMTRFYGETPPLLNKVMADVLFDKQEWYNAYDSSLYTLDDMEKLFKAYVQELSVIVHQEESEMSRLPHQVEKNFPWYYKTYQWRQ